MTVSEHRINTSGYVQVNVRETLYFLFQTASLSESWINYNGNMFLEAKLLAGVVHLSPTLITVEPVESLLSVELVVQQQLPPLPHSVEIQGLFPSVGVYHIQKTQGKSSIVIIWFYMSVCFFFYWYWHISQADPSQDWLILITCP